MSTALLTSFLRDILFNDKSMDLLAAKDHFYLNGNFYNDTDRDQPAEIHVEDTSDILSRNSNWLCHVVRFSIDTMKTLVYCEKDETASWEIIIVSRNGQPTDSFRFALTRDYHSPQDLIHDMNMAGRFRKCDYQHDPVRNVMGRRV